MFSEATASVDEFGTEDTTRDLGLSDSDDEEDGDGDDDASQMLGSVQDLAAATDAAFNRIVSIGEAPAPRPIQATGKGEPEKPPKKPKTPPPSATPHKVIIGL